MYKILVILSLAILPMACNQAPTILTPTALAPDSSETIAPRLPTEAQIKPMMPSIIETLPGGASAITSQKKITLETVSLVERLVTLTAHTGRVMDVVFSPDGAYLASAGLDRKIRLWDVLSWKEIYSFDLPAVDINAIAFSPDSNLLASAFGIWNVKTGEIVYDLDPGMSEVGHVAFSPDGRLLAMSGYPKSVMLWEVSNSQVARKLDIPEEVPGFFNISFSSDGKRLAAGSPRAGTVFIWEVESGQIVQALEMGNKSDLHDIEFSPDGSHLAGGGTANFVGIWDIPSGELIDKLSLNNGIYGLAYSADGKILALASCNRVAQLWSLESNRVLRNLPHADELLAVAFSPDGALLATGGYDDTVVIWGIP